MNLPKVKLIVHIVIASYHILIEELKVILTILPIQMSYLSN